MHVWWVSRVVRLVWKSVTAVNIWLCECMHMFTWSSVLMYCQELLRRKFWNMTDCGGQIIYFCSWHQITKCITSFILCEKYCKHIHTYMCPIFFPPSVFITSSLSLLSSSSPPSISLSVLLPYLLLHYSLPFSSHSLSLSHFPTVCDATWPESAVFAASEWNSLALMVMCLMLLDLLQEVNHAGQ